MRQRGNQYQQRACGYGRFYKGDCDLRNDLALLCARNPGRFLQRGVHTLQRADHLHEYKWEVIGTLHKNNAANAVNVNGRIGQMEGCHQPFIHITGPAGKKQIPCHGPEKWGEHIWNRKHGPHESFGRDIAPPQEPCIEQAHNGAEQSNCQGNHNGIPHCLQVIYISYD